MAQLYGTSKFTPEKFMYYIKMNSTTILYNSALDSFINNYTVRNW